MGGDTGNSVAGGYTGRMLRMNPEPDSALHNSRPLALDDIDPLAEWLCRLPLYQRYDFQPAIIAKTLEEALSIGDWLQVHAVGAQTCAFAWCQERGAFGRSPYMRLIAVRAGYQRQGIGREMLHQAESWARRDHTSLTLLVSDYNHSAQRFYRREGYRESGRLPAFVLADVDEIIYHKILVV